MSGGSYDYLYSKIDELRHWPDSLEHMAATCRRLAAETKTIGYGAEEHETTLEERAKMMVHALRLEQAVRKLREAAALVAELEDTMHAVEWIESCDWGPDALVK